LKKDRVQYELCYRLTWFNFVSRAYSALHL